MFADRKLIQSSLKTFLTLAILLSCGVSDVLACPNCKAGIQSAGGNLVGAYQMSILFMMAMPFLLIGGFSLYMYYEIRKAQRLQAENINSSSEKSLQQN